MVCQQLPCSYHCPWLPGHDVTPATEQSSHVRCEQRTVTRATGVMLLSHARAPWTAEDGIPRDGVT